MHKDEASRKKYFKFKTRQNKTKEKIHYKVRSFKFYKYIRKIATKSVNVWKIGKIFKTFFFFFGVKKCA